MYQEVALNSQIPDSTVCQKSSLKNFTKINILGGKQQTCIQTQGVQGSDIQETLCTLPNRARSMDNLSSNSVVTQGQADYKKPDINDILSLIMQPKQLFTTPSNAKTSFMGQQKQEGFQRYQSQSKINQQPQMADLISALRNPEPVVQLQTNPMYSLLH